MRLGSFDDTEVCHLVHLTSLLYHRTPLSGGVDKTMPTSRTTYIGYWRNVMYVTARRDRSSP
jgi:hypothetical protein